MEVLVDQEDVLNGMVELEVLVVEVTVVMVILVELVIHPLQVLLKVTLAEMLMILVQFL